MTTAAGTHGTFVLWHYIPSLIAAVMFVVIFGILSVLHTWRLIKIRTWYCIPLVVGGLFETAGYIGRILAHSSLDSINPYIIQSLLILLAPALFAASIYMALGRVMVATCAESYSIIPVRWLTKVFVAGDVLCFLMQSSGGGLLAKAKNADGFELGEHIILGGLILQIVVFGFFVITAGIFHSRLRQKPTPEVLEGNMLWERLLTMLYVVSALISIRNAFRVIEYAMGSDGYLLIHEWTLYAFDAVLMAAVLLISSMWYTSTLQARPKITHVESMEERTFRPKESR